MQTNKKKQKKKKERKKERKKEKVPLLLLELGMHKP